MKRNLLGITTISVLIVAVIAHWLWVIPLQHDIHQTGAKAALMEDSLAVLRRVVDSLTAQRPGLGEYMSTIQLHTAKLWFAAQATNWDLARYEHDELAETMEAAEALHAKKGSVDVSAVLQSVRQTQLPLINRCISAKNLRSFDDAYRQTLAACNGCHRPAGYGFVHIIIPKREPVTNQQWKISKQQGSG